MRGRLHGLMALATLLLAGGTVHAHRLNAEATVQPDGKVKVEAWFDVTGDAAGGAKVQVFGPDGGVLVEGKTDADGVFLFDRPGTSTLNIVVSAGQGHQRTVTLAGDGPAQGEPAQHGTSVTVRDVLAGVGFLLALAAFVMSVRNARRLQQIESSR